MAQTTSAADTSEALKELGMYVQVNFSICSNTFLIADSKTSRVNFPKTTKAFREAFKEFNACQEKGELELEPRFAALKEQLAANEPAKTALKELYIYWRTEMNRYDGKNQKMVQEKFQSLLERTRVEASW
jgi:hypothetical protein